MLLTVILEKILLQWDSKWVPWTARRSNQSILKEINSEYSMEGLMLKLKFQYFGHLMGRANSLAKTLMLGKLKAGGEGYDRGQDGWMAWLTRCKSEQTQMGMVDGEGQGSLACCSPWGCRVGHDQVTEQQQWEWVTKHFILPIICQSFHPPSNQMKANKPFIHPTNISELSILWPDLWSFSVQWGQSRMSSQRGDSLKKELHRKRGSMQTHRLLHILLVPRGKRGVLLEEMKGVPYREGTLRRRLEGVKEPPWGVRVHGQGRREPCL